MPKTHLPLAAVQAFLQRELGGDVGQAQRLVEGEESQAFGFSHGGRPYVLRINRGTTGFEKDAYAYRRFHSSALPIPAVVRLGQIDPDHAYCISEKCPGTTLQDLEPALLQQSLEPTFRVWEALGRVDVSATTGWGDFDPAGQGQYASWRAYLRSSLDPRRYDGETVPLTPDAVLVRRMTEAFEARVARCPETRQLVHGDFGSNNVLYADGRITAVLDWDNAKYGDPLFDVAGAHYWRTWLACMEAFAVYSERHLSALPDYRTRIECYQLWIGLDELHAQAAAGDRPALEWHQRRCAEIVDAL